LTAFYRIVELTFTAYAVPALLVPVVWLARRWWPGRGSGRRPETADRLHRAIAAYAIVFFAWIGLRLVLALGVPVERGGPAAAAVSWIGYALLNLLLASLLVRFTAGYGDLPEGSSRDRLFVRFLSAIVAQPVATACAFAVLYRIMGVVYHLKVPSLGAVQEGI
jgi:uncharacterized membrane protein